MITRYLNVLTMKDITSIDAFSINEEGEQFFDFNKIFPMSESLLVGNLGNRDISDAVLYYITEKLTIPCYCIPEEEKDAIRKFPYLDIDFTFGPLNLKERIEFYNEEEKENLYHLGGQYTQNIINYGYPTWHRWRIRYWGSQWNSYHLHIIDNNTIEFHTAFGKPKPIFLKLSELFPEESIHVSCYSDEERTRCSQYDFLGGHEVITFQGKVMLAL